MERANRRCGCFERELAAAPNLRWIGYLSTVGVYGDHGGRLGGRDDAAAPAQRAVRCAGSRPSRRGWISGARSGKAVQVFRLSGIYGPGQNALVNLAQGTARRIIKPGQVFNRIHVEDIAGALAASMERPSPGAIYNVTDDEPAPPQDVVAYAAGLMGVGLAARSAVRDRAALADGAQLLWREQAGFERGDEAGAGLGASPSHLSRGAQSAPCRRRRRLKAAQVRQAACRVASAPKWPI